MGAYLPFEKLRLDFCVGSGMCAAMANDEGNLRIIGELLVRAGAIMEDESVALVSRLPNKEALLGARITRLRQVSADLGALAAAAEALWRRPAL